MDLAKYRAIFVEEATEHLAEISNALLELEKDPARAEAIDLVFRMAHSIKGMAASLDYSALSELSHVLEDRMQASRAAGRVADGDEMARLFRGLEGLETMVGVVRNTGEPPLPAPELVRDLSTPIAAAAAPGEAETEQKKASGPPRRAESA